MDSKVSWKCLFVAALTSAILAGACSKQAPPPEPRATAAKSVLQAGVSCVKTAYQLALKQKPRLAGKMKVCMSVDPAGKVTQVTLGEDTLGDANLSGSIKGCFAKLSFAPQGDKGETICVPVVLKPGKKAAGL